MTQTHYHLDITLIFPQNESLTPNNIAPEVILGEPSVRQSNIGSFVFVDLACKQGSQLVAFI